MQKFYCYADETGQDTKGRFFLVSVIIISEEKEILRDKLRKIEGESKKAKKKWTKATLKQKEFYIKRIVEDSLFSNKIFYSTYAETTEYLDLTVRTITKVILNKIQANYRITVLIDGLSKSERKIVGSRLRKNKIKIEKIRGLRHRSDEFIRLADGVAGFVRDYLEKKPYAVEIYKIAVEKKTIQEIKNPRG